MVLPHGKAHHQGKTDSNFTSQQKKASKVQTAVGREVLNRRRATKCAKRVRKLLTGQLEIMCAPCGVRHWAGRERGKGHLMPLSTRGGAIKPLVLEPPQAHVIADDIQQPDHLTEDEDPACSAACLGAEASECVCTCISR